MKIGETIKKLRVDNKLTQSDLAEMLDVTRVAVSKWELNKSYPSMDNLRAISKIFNVTFDELLEEPKKEPEHSLEEGENEEMGSKDNTPKKSAGATNNVEPAKSQDVSSKPVENDVMASNEHSLEAQSGKAKKNRRIINWAFGCGMTLIGLAAVTLTSIGLAGTFVVKGEDTSNSNAISSENTSPIQSIYVSQNPTYMTYLVGQSFKTDGMVVTAVHEDDTESELEGWTIDAPESFDSTNNNLTINVKYSDPSGNEFTTDLSGVRVADHMNGVFSPTDLKVTSDPIPQLAGSPFDDTNLAFHLIYDVNGETKEDEEHSYKLNSNPTGNSYDVIKLSENKALTSDTTDVTILYSQGKSFQLPVTMIESIEITPNKDSYDAKEDKFSVNAKGVKKDGTKIDLDPKFFTFTSSKEKIEAGKSFTYNGEHEITCKYGKYSKKIATFNVTVSGGKDFAINPNLNDDSYFKECEDLVWNNDIEQTEINACQKLQEVASPFNWEEITSSNQGTYYKDLCGYSEFHAKAYLGYTGNYKYSGNGFVHNFDGDGSDSGAFMRYTFTAPGGGESDLILRGSTNVAGSTIYDSQDLKISQAVKITLNGTDITNLFADKAFKGVTSTTPDAQNRSGEAQGISLEGRYRYVNWTEVKAKVQLQPGENVLMITAKNNGQSGHWDSIKFDCTPYKTPLTKIAHAEVENDENVTLKNCYSLRQLKDTFDYKTAQKDVDYVDIKENNGTTSNCDNAELHAKGFLGYTDEKYKYSGKGFVLGFDSNQDNDVSKKASITYRFNSSKASIGSLILRAASNDTDNVNGKYKTADIKLNKAVEITLNGVSIKDKITDDKILVGNSDETANTSVNRSDYDGRYRFLNWTDIEITGLSLNEGENTLVIEAANANKSGQWDSITVKA